MSKDTLCHLQAEMFKKQMYLLHFSCPVYWLKENDPKDLDSGAIRQKDPEPLLESCLPNTSIGFLCEPRKKFNYVKP